MKAKRLFIISCSLIFMLLLVSSSLAKAKEINLPPLPTTMELNPFSEIEAVVGYIQKENGEKFAIIETPEGVKLIKVENNKPRKRELK